LRVWRQSSTATIDGNRYDEGMGVPGGEEAEVQRTRRVMLRSAMTVSAVQGGVLDALLGLTRWGFGGETNGMGGSMCRGFMGSISCERCGG
jgi:hypothetical protein